MEHNTSSCPDGGAEAHEELTHDGQCRICGRPIDAAAECRTTASGHAAHNVCIDEIRNLAPVLEPEEIHYGDLRQATEACYWCGEHLRFSSPFIIDSDQMMEWVEYLENESRTMWREWNDPPQYYSFTGDVTRRVHLRCWEHPAFRRLREQEQARREQREQEMREQDRREQEKREQDRREHERVEHLKAERRRRGECSNCGLALSIFERMRGRSSHRFCVTQLDR